MPVAELASLMVIPALALGFVVLYNTFYQLNYRRLGNIAVWNNLQLALDALVVTVLVYFSGGVNSWFWSMYSLFILEAAFILPRSRDTWVLAAALHAAARRRSSVLELLGVLPHVAIPFASAERTRDPVYVSVRYLLAGGRARRHGGGVARCSSASSAPSWPRGRRSPCSTRPRGCTRARTSCARSAPRSAERSGTPGRSTCC